jgi:hypothetical protein
LRELPELEEFIAEENIHLPQEPRQKEVRADNDTVKTSNRTNSPPPVDASFPSEDAACLGAHTFDPNPPRGEEENIQLATTDNQAKLMRWHYPSATSHSHR